MIPNFHIMLQVIPMSNIDNFKEFVKDNSILINYVKKGEHTWQEFYELYDLYKDDKNIWNKYLNKEDKTPNSKININNFLDYAKNIDVDKLQDGITSIQKAIDLFDGMLTKDADTKTNNYHPKPIYRRFDD